LIFKLGGILDFVIAIANKEYLPGSTNIIPWEKMAEYLPEMSKAAMPGSTNIIPWEKMAEYLPEMSKAAILYILL
jgi:hypothetical protein